MLVDSEESDCERAGEVWSVGAQAREGSRKLARIVVVAT